jgi:two-component system sensor histidine kinase UhpB
VREVLAFAPLERAQWGVTVHQSEDEVFASMRLLQMRIFVLMLIMLAGALVLVYLTTRSVITPVQALTTATKRIAAGDLDTPLGIQGKDEISTLAQSFDAMREQLKESIAEIKVWNRELDARVSERTAAVEKARTEILQLYEELQRKEQVRRELLNRMFAAQEEERKRIARELHDETAQVLTGLSYALDDAAEAPPSTNLKPQLERMHELTTTALKEIRRIILDLRPTMLDHLGLIPAIGWYAETRLNGLGIHLSIRESGQARRLAPAIETALFRVVQEAINNIAQHSRATRAELRIEFDSTQVQVLVKDNGKGFDPVRVFSASDTQRGLGLIGMDERMSAVGGKFIIHSTPREGTIIQLTVPINDSENV